MNSIELKSKPVPPSLMKSLTAGFDAISNHLSLIIFAIALDLFLWFGPRMSLVRLFSKYLGSSLSASELGDPEMLKVIQTALEEFNLLNLMRTFPIGIPSLMASRSTLESPLGRSFNWEVPSLGSALGIWVVITLVGLGVGTLYFSMVAQAAVSNKVNWRKALSRWPWDCSQILLLSLLWWGLLIGLTIPSSCFLTTVLLSGFGSQQVLLIVALVFGGMLIWLLIPLVFSPHGVFVNHSIIWTSIKDSVRLTRSTLPTTSLLLLTIVVLSEGLDVLWSLPTETSWLALIGIVGHAFVATSLLAASFIYYQDAHRWVKRIAQQANATLA